MFPCYRKVVRLFKRILIRLEHREKLLKPKTVIAKTKGKKNVYEEFSTIEERVPRDVVLPDR